MSACTTPVAAKVWCRVRRAGRQVEGHPRATSRRRWSVLWRGCATRESGTGHDTTQDGGRARFPTPDEEIGSPGSQATIERLAAEADYALCLEAARENGDLVWARKGIADLHLTVAGRAAHAGVEPERGANAALSAAHMVTAIQGLNGRWPAEWLDLSSVVPRTPLLAALITRLGVS